MLVSGLCQQLGAQHSSGVGAVLRALRGCWDRGGGGQGHCHCKCHLNAHWFTTSWHCLLGQIQGKRAEHEPALDGSLRAPNAWWGTPALLLCVSAVFSWGPGSNAHQRGPGGPPPGFRLQEGADVEGSLSGGAVGAQWGLGGGRGQAGPPCGWGKACPVPEPAVHAPLTCCRATDTPPAGGSEAPGVECVEHGVRVCGVCVWYVWPHVPTDVVKASSPLSCLSPGGLGRPAGGTPREAGLGGCHVQSADSSEGLGWPLTQDPMRPGGGVAAGSPGPGLHPVPVPGTVCMSTRGQAPTQLPGTTHLRSQVGARDCPSVCGGLEQFQGAASGASRSRDPGLCGPCQKAWPAASGSQTPRPGPVHTPLPPAREVTADTAVQRLTRQCA